MEETKARITAALYWSGMFGDIQRHCQTCDVCQKTARRTGKEGAPMVCPTIVSDPFVKIAMDIVGPLQRTKAGHEYILTIIDEATRYPEAIPLKDIEAKTVANALIGLFSRVGIPKVILTDQGTNFTSTLLKELYNMLNIKGITTSPYRTELNGNVERFNGTLKAVLKKLCSTNSEEWDVMLPYALFCYREVPHESTGFSPFELLYGWPVRWPIGILMDVFTGEGEMKMSVVEHVQSIRQQLAEVSELVKENLTECHKKVKSWHDKNATKREFWPEDEVLGLLPSDASKMKAHWKGPYRVIGKANDVNYKINVGGRRGQVTYHSNLLGKYKRAVLLSATVCDKFDGGGRIEFPLAEIESLDKISLNSRLTKEQRDQVRNVFAEFEHVLTSKPGKTNLITHNIRTTTDIPITQKPYRIPHAKRAEVRAIVAEMLQQELIRPSTSPWSSPVVLVQKKDGSLRLYELFEKLGNTKYISKLDMTKGYWQVPLSKEAQEKSDFVTPFGLYEFTIMPFGMKTLPATFSPMMDLLLSKLRGVASYFDDIIIYSETWEDHLHDLRAVLERLQENNLTVKPSKCDIGKDSIVCLGHIVGGGQIKPDEAKVKAMVDFPLPTTNKAVRSFLGMVGYYRKFIKNFAQLSAPLCMLIRKGQPNRVTWDENAVKSFSDLKNALVKARILINPVFERPFVLQTDASDVSIGAVLSQYNDNKDEHPIAYLSRKLLPREQNYSTIEKECLAIVWAVETLHYYLCGAPLSVETDHNPLTWLSQNKGKNNGF
ncbi:hypothetical protein ACJMK2_033790 [Sinanodonta woodiana]|uniref:Integrase catalytic domain-containing protein n=1 Tax=Sinanodonta woodiana TaxID=1069815 RepID=A0ABD3WQZ2_SINWO